MMMKSQTVCLVVLISITLSSCIPLDLGFGGVYNSPDANAYWERRFGRGFFANLASIQKNINNAAKLNKASLGTESPIPVAIDLRQSVEDNVQNDLSEVVEVVPSVVEPIQSGPLFLEDVQF